MKNKLVYNINEELLQDFINLANGLFNPLKGFMSEKNYRSVVDKMRLDTGEVWTIPITLDVTSNLFKLLKKNDELFLLFKKQIIGSIIIDDKFIVKRGDIKKIFKTEDIQHPGVKKELARHSYRIGGKIKVILKSILRNNLQADKIKKIFKEKGWKTVVGFQTRNPIHKAHEHLQRTAMELFDGVFINPLIGWKKKGDFSELAVINGYREMLKHYYPKESVYFNVLKTPMRYAGPREAVFHAIIRRNMGCTHFIVGRDHAGVGNYYGIYDAQKLAQKLASEDNLGIQILCLKEPVYCKKCNQIVSYKNCSHTNGDIVPISGTKIRNMLSAGKEPESFMMRKEVAKAIIKLNQKMFIQ